METWTVGHKRGAREGDLVDGELGVVEVEKEGFYFCSMSVLLWSGNGRDLPFCWNSGGIVCLQSRSCVSRAFK